MRQNPNINGGRSQPLREGLSRLLETTPDFQIVGQCADVSGAIAALSETPADVVLLDFDLGDEQGYQLLLDLKNRQNTAKVLMVTAGMTDAATLQVMEAGASGVFPATHRSGTTCHGHPSGDEQ